MNKEKIREVALRVAREMQDPDDGRLDYGDYLTRCLAELSKDVEPVAWMFPDDEEHGYIAYQGKPPTQEQVAYLAKWNRPAWVPLYLHPPLTEQDKLDAERWRAYQKRKQDLLDRGFLRNPLRDETIDRAMENGK